MEAVAAAESPEALAQLENPSLWIAQEGSHRSWLKALCTVLLDSGGVKSEALLLSRPLCVVRAETAFGVLFQGCRSNLPPPPPGVGRLLSEAAAPPRPLHPPARL